MPGYIFRKIHGRTVAIAAEALDSLHTAATPNKWREQIGKAMLRKRVGFGPAEQASANKFRRALVRKYPSQIGALDEFHVQNPQFFHGLKWMDMMTGASGQTYAIPKIPKPTLPEHIGEIGVGIGHKDLVTALHELGHAEQFKEYSKITRLRFQHAGTPVLGTAFEILHEGDAYWRGAKMVKGPWARRVVALNGAKRMLTTKVYGPKIMGAAAVLTAAAAGTTGVAAYEIEKHHHKDGKKK